VVLGGQFLDTTDKLQTPIVDADVVFEATLAVPDDPGTSNQSSMINARVSFMLAVSLKQSSQPLPRSSRP
jgi:hypothetical protein